MGSIDIADFISKLIIYMIVWIFAVSAHEAAHAWMSLKFGDDTAEKLGRVTLNPIPHIDPIGTLLLPIIGFIVGYSGGMAGLPLIMWGKPTPVNPLRWRNKDLANVMVSLAGIGVNLIIAITVSIILKIGFAFQFFTAENIRSGITGPIFMLLFSTMFLNVALAIFNLLPFPPLDGSKALQTFLPESFNPLFELLETYGFLILIVLLQLGVIGFLAGPLNNLIIGLLMPTIS
jgi:Zn-dependent protease